MLDNKINSLLKPLKLKYFLKRLIHIIAISLMVWGGISFVFITASRFIPITFVWNKILSILVFSLILGVLWSFYKKPSFKETAILVDSFGLKERAATSLELKGKDTLVARIQKKDTIKLLEEKDLKSKISLKPSVKILLFILVFLTATMIVGFIPTRSYVLAKEKENNLEKLEKEKDKIEKVKKNVKKDELLTFEEKEKIEKSLEKIKNNLEKPKSLKDAQKEIVKFKKELNKIDDEKKAQKLNEIVKKLSDKGFTKELAQKLKSRNTHEVAKEIEKMADKIKNLNKNEMEQLAKELKELQDLLKNSPELANAFKEIRDAAAQSIQEGKTNSNMTNKSLQNLNQAINSQLSNSQLSSELNEALNSIDELNNTLSEMSGENNVDNNQNQDGSSNNGSNGNGGNQGNGTGGNGAGNGSTPGNDSNGGSSQSAGGNRQGSSGNEAKDYEKIFAPKTLDVDGEGSKIYGGMNKSGQKDTIEVKKFGEEMGESIPYSEVFKNYKNSEYERLEAEEIPPNMKEIVKEYFIKLDE